MENIHDCDKYQLAQLIRFNAEMLDIATRIRNPGLDEKTRQMHDLENLLDIWKTRKYKAGPDIRWAVGRLRNFRKWMPEQKLIISKPGRRTVPMDPSKLKVLIRSRRSIRFWKEKKVPRPHIHEIIEAGIWAPSAFNRLPWRFFVVERPAFAKASAGKDASNEGMFASAPVMIFVGIDERIFFEKYSGPLDAGLAMQNMLLMAHALGLGTCLVYQGEYEDPVRLEKLYHIPQYCKVYCVIMVGYPDENPEAPARMNIKDITEFI